MLLSSRRWSKRNFSLASVLVLSALQVIPALAEGEIASATPDMPSEKPPVSLDAVYKPAIASAKKALAEKLAKLTKSDRNSASDAASKLAACEFAEEDFKAAATHLNQAIKLLSETAPDQKSRLVGLHKHLGDCEIIEGRVGPAILHYETAASLLSKLEPDSPLKKKVLRSLGDAYLREKSYSKAIDTFKALYDYQKATNDPSLGWTAVSLRDAYEQLGRKAEADKYFEISSDIFRPMIKNAGVQKSDGNVSQVSLDLWDALEVEPESAPAISWEPPNGQKPWAILVCIHGMGLHKSAYEAFGKAMSTRGVSVFALDVRGFGSWCKLDRPKVNFELSESDISHVAAMLKKNNPDIPIFLLGESMGGAIALQSALSCKDAIGVISSVPAADRYNGTKTKMKVAWHVLARAKNDYDITKDVIERVSNDERLVDEWKQDREARFKLGTDELIKFDAFMKSTKEKVQRLDKPVLIVQGGADPLVKPSSTIELYDAIKGKDKTLIIMGFKEHLIFENEQFFPMMLEGVTNWLRAHSGLDGAPPWKQKEWPPRVGSVN
ncbi:MAG TPA: alpha/beta fold hydrolase [Candidatus Melainabacteria bacterium]|nr:alpha/beta fold hydrolase [Candidatus Melainabacteria bacterium]